jgi:hypothetical protein
MMRKLLLTILFAFAGMLLVNAQCTPSVACLNGICPDTVTNLPTAHVSVLYGTSLTLVVPVDTVYATQTVPIDSINYTSTTGLPTGFTVTPDKTGWPGGTKGCVYITGTPDLSMQGVTYKLTLNVTAHVKYMGTIAIPVPLTYSGYKIFVKDTVLGINEQEHGDISFITSMDPSGNAVNITIHSSQQMNHASLIINDVTGRELLRINDINGNDFAVQDNELSKGMYIISLVEKENVIAKSKMVIR